MQSLGSEMRLSLEGEGHEGQALLDVPLGMMGAGGIDLAEPSVLREAVQSFFPLIKFLGKIPRRRQIGVTLPNRLASWDHQWSLRICCSGIR